MECLSTAKKLIAANSGDRMMVVKTGASLAMTEISVVARIITIEWRWLPTTRTKPITLLPDSHAQLMEAKLHECSSVVRVPGATITTSGSTHETRTGSPSPM